jgi:hypothetical protein
VPLDVVSESIRSDHRRRHTSFRLEKSTETGHTYSSRWSPAALTCTLISGPTTQWAKKDSDVDGTIRTSFSDTAQARAIASWRALSIVLVVRLLFLGAALLALWAGLFGNERNLLDTWARFDARHFVAIAEHGYHSPLVRDHLTAFFPLYPLAIRILPFDSVFSGLLISTVASFVALAFLYRLAIEELGSGTATWAVLFLSLFPTAVFLVAPYSESLFLAGAIPAFYFARRGDWKRVGLPCAVATATRVGGIFLLLGLAAEFLSQRKKDVPGFLIAIALGLAPIVMYAVFLWRSTGNPLDFVEAQRLGWGREFVGPIKSFATTVRLALERDSWLFGGEIVAAAAGVTAVIAAARKRWWGYSVYMGTTLAVLMSSTFYGSLPRVLLTFFPIPLILAAMANRHPTWGRLALWTSGSFAFLGVVAFTSGSFFW